MLYFQLLFLLFVFQIFPQTIVIDDEKFQMNLWDQELDQKQKVDFTKGSFLKNENDFILCKGRMWSGNPPKSTYLFTYREKQIDNIGQFNNEAIELIERNEEGDWSEANAMLSAMIQADPMFFPARYNYARFLFIQKKFQEASYEFLQARNIIPAYYRSYLHLGHIYLFLGEKQKAEEIYKEAAWRNPLNDEAHISLAEIYWKEGLITRARDRIKEADKTNDPTEATIIRRQKPAFPVLDFTKAIENPLANPNPKIAEALLYFHQEKYALAYKLFKSINTEHLNKEKIPYLKKMHY
ncbi:MAG TPA: tetratricopeptide repeat protein, partial [Leptospiraceae bacterium]|nr:tetratricopeptide repeat protein [Leptospiraceae bacterium]